MQLIGVVLIVLSIFFLIILKSDYLGILEIFFLHFQLFKDSKKEYYIFYFFPFLLSIGIVFLSLNFSDVYYEISVVVGIILSMLFAGLSILTTYDFSRVVVEVQKEKSRVVIEQTINSIKFDCLLCLIILLINVLIKIKFGYKLVSIYCIWMLPIIKYVVAILVLYLFLVVILTLLLIIKNMFELIRFNLYVKKD